MDTSSVSAPNPVEAFLTDWLQADRPERANYPPKTTRRLCRAALGQARAVDVQRFVA